MSIVDYEAIATARGHRGQARDGRPSPPSQPDGERVRPGVGIARDVHRSSGHRLAAADRLQHVGWVETRELSLPSIRHTGTSASAVRPTSFTGEAVCHSYPFNWSGSGRRTSGASVDDHFRDVQTRRSLRRNAALTSSMRLVVTHSTSKHLRRSVFRDGRVGAARPSARLRVVLATAWPRKWLPLPSLSGPWTPSVDTRFGTESED